MPAYESWRCLASRLHATHQQALWAARDSPLVRSGPSRLLASGRSHSLGSRPKSRTRPRGTHSISWDGDHADDTLDAGSMCWARPLPTRQMGRREGRAAAQRSSHGPQRCRCRAARARRARSVAAARPRASMGASAIQCRPASPVPHWRSVRKARQKSAWVRETSATWLPPPTPLVVCAACSCRLHNC